LRAIAADRFATNVIGKDQDDVGTLFGKCCGEERSDGKQGCEESEYGEESLPEFP
jgi:hypothetical protein